MRPPRTRYDQPLRRVVRALQEADRPPAQWEVASLEPGLDLAPGAPAGWTLPVRRRPPASMPWGRLPAPFVFRTHGPGLGAPPAGIAEFHDETGDCRSEADDLGDSRAARASPSRSFFRQAWSPARSSLPGALRLGQWTATFVAPPADGMLWRASFPRADAGRLAAMSASSSPSPAFRADPAGSGCRPGFRRSARCGRPPPPG